MLLVLAVFSLSASCASMKRDNKTQESVAHFKLGVGHLNQNQIQPAFVEFQKAYELDPQNRDVLYAIGTVYLLYFDDMPKAVENFEKAIALSPDYSDAYNSLGYAYEKMGKYETAISFYKKAVSNLLYGSADKSYVNMGNSYYRMGKFDQAILSYKEAMKRAPEDYKPYMRMSLSLNAMGKYGDAAAAMNQALAMHPLFRGNREKAMDDLGTARLKASGLDEKDISDYLEILKY